MKLEIITQPPATIVAQGQDKGAKMTGQRITKADLAELCRRVDLPALLAADGVRVHRRGATFACSLRPEDKNPSCILYPPGVGRRGSDGWTLKDYGDGWGGDALAYLVEKRGLSFLDAVRELADRTGWIPDGLEPERSGRPRTSRRSTTADAPAPTEIPAGPPPLLPGEQFAAACSFVGAVVDLCPGSAAKGEAYLASRGCLPDGWPGGAYVLTGEDCRKLTAQLEGGPDAALLHRAGLLKPAADGKPARLACWVSCFSPRCATTSRPNRTLSSVRHFMPTKYPRTRNSAIKMFYITAVVLHIYRTFNDNIADYRKNHLTNDLESPIMLAYENWKVCRHGADEKSDEGVGDQLPDPSSALSGGDALLPELRSPRALLLPAF